MSAVWCETEAHGTEPHAETEQCKWPCYVGPSATGYSPEAAYVAEYRPY